MCEGARPTCVPPQTPIPLPINPCIEETASRAALITSGALQGLGALLTVVGLPAHSQVIGGDRGVAIVPTATGAAAIGTF
jgi:glutaminase